MKMKISSTKSFVGTKSVLQFLGVASAISVSGLALILVLTSLSFLSNPLRSCFHGNLLALDQFSTLLNDNQTVATLWSVGDAAGVKEKHFTNEFSTISSDHKPQSQAGFEEFSEKKDSGTYDLYHGKWVYDERGPLYNDNSCPIISEKQNCQRNGRPDKDYENWRWQPEECELPRFDARKFLRLMRNKTLAFVGDSVARNQVESLVCALWQVEVPIFKGSRRIQRWRFRSTSTTVARIWSAWLVNKTTEPFPSVPDDIDKVHLDIPDENFMNFLPQFDVVVVSTGHWFTKQSAYIQANTVVGGQLWRPKTPANMQINNTDAFSIAVQTGLTSISSHPNFTGLAIFRTYSPDHYEKGTWNLGGTCSGNVRPATELVRNEYTQLMHDKQIHGFAKVTKKGGNSSKFLLMDITESFGYRPDGHPGPYTSTEAKKIGQREDCLHWCMPGPIDAWNEILVEIIRREFEGVTKFSSSV